MIKEDAWYSLLCSALTHRHICTHTCSQTHMRIIHMCTCKRNERTRKVGDMAQGMKSLVTNSKNLGSIFRTYMVEGEN